MDTAENYSTRNLIADIWRYVQPHRRGFLIATALEIIACVAWLYPPYLFAGIISFLSIYTAGTEITPLYSAFALTVISYVTCYVGFYLAQTAMMRISEKTALAAQIDAMRHLMLLDISWHETENAGSKFKRIERGAASIDKILRMWINDILEIGISLIGVLFVIFTFDRAMAVALTLFLVTYYLIARFYRKRGTAFIKLINKQEEHWSSMLFEAINNIRSVKVMSMDAKILKNLAAQAMEIFTNVKERIFWMRGGNSVRNFYAQMFRIGAVLFIALGIVRGRHDIGFLVLFGSYFMHLWQAMSKLTDASDDFVIAKNAIARLQEMLAVPVTIDDETGKVAFPKDWQEISLKNVSFSYNNKPVLRNISFTVKRGEKIGVVGLSGAGKSTLFKLLLKEHESYKGKVAFDGVPLTGISKKDYFNYVAVVLQETELFNASLKDNVTITNQKQEKNTALFEKALVTSHVKDFMPKLPKGTNTIIGEKGVKLSGGEKQRVGIARAIFKDPQVFLLDEATSHLDIESEEKIQDSLHAFFGGVTAIVIAHRLTTIKEMDRILVIEDGKILESGTFAELHAAQGRFFELWEKQKL